MAIKALRLPFAVLAVATTLAGCGRSELSCGSSDETEAVMNVLKGNPPTQLLAAASSDVIQKRQQELTDTAASKLSSCAETEGKEEAEAMNAFAEKYPQAMQQMSEMETADPGWAHLPHERLPLLYHRLCDFAWEEVSAERQGQSAAHAALMECQQIFQKPQNDFSACRNLITDQTQEAVNNTAKDANAAAVYSINAIRMESRDETTGAVVCNAQLRADIPDVGAANEDIEYKIEKTTDGNLYVTVQGAN